MAEELKPVDDPVKQLTAIPWYESRVLRALIVSGVSQIVALLQVRGVINFAPDVDFWVELFFQIVAIVAAAYAAYARARAPTPPVKASQAKADEHNATKLPLEIKPQ